MKPIYAACVVCFSLTTAIMAPSAMVNAAPSIESAAQLDPQTRQLLEDSLSVNELDQEIQRIGQEEQTARTKYEQLEQQAVTSQQQLSDAKLQSDKILVAYYTGEREQLRNAFWAAGSISGVIAFYEYYKMILDHDQKIMADYRSRYEQIQSIRSDLLRTSAELTDIGDRLKQQRQRVASLQTRIHSGLASSSEPETARQLIEEMNAYWENIGLYEVKNYFRALAQSMQQFPDFLQSQPGAIRINGRQYTIVIEQKQLNDFLHHTAGLPDSLQFNFEQDRLVVTGQEGQLSLEIIGHYEIENTTQNVMRFRVDQLVFNGLRLPDTTCAMLENEFDLGFYPEQIIPYLKATSVAIVPQSMNVQLELSLN
ncbi:hypothetical protein [Paenibacillus wulumuqiensis]|uniref:hypothetical protein n=1 Tax=Paenibacillus wulumuqiensis TaxID=1567107 RepID=UPI0006197886|nr:hypothetical protein [Paenibacillus wulumuqiensis]